MKKIVAGLLLASAPAMADTPVFTVENRILEIPVVEVKEGGQSNHFQVRFMANQDFSQFTLIYGEPVAKPSEINLTGVNGSFSGRISSYLPGTLQRGTAPFAPNCSGFPFDVTSADMKFNVVGNKIDFEHEVFASTKCLYTGVVDGSNVTGTFQCSNFTNGTWRLNTLKTNSALADSVTAHISLVGNNNCSYDASFVGLRK